MTNVSNYSKDTILHALLAIGHEIHLCINPSSYDIKALGGAINTDYELDMSADLPIDCKFVLLRAVANDGTLAGSLNVYNDIANGIKNRVVILVANQYCENILIAEVIAQKITWRMGTTPAGSFTALQLTPMVYIT